MLKLVRIGRISKIISQLNAKQEIKAMLKVINLVFLLVIYIHVMTCVMWFVVELEKEWVPPLDFIYAETKLYTLNIFDKFLIMFYHSVNIMALVEVCP
jgi:hypothetical protein